MTWRASTIPAAILLMLQSFPLRADFVVAVNAEGMLDGAVVTATPLDPTIARPEPPAVVEMEQRNRQFDPFILPVPVNVPVAFPNRDDTAHHVYSFSPVGSFELPLYKGESPRTITFSRSGVVPLGCNIHDWMIGYIYVVDAPWYAQLSHGSARFNDLPDGTYEVSIWHPAIDRLPVPHWQVTVSEEAQEQSLSLDYPFAEVTQPQPPRERFDERADY